MHSVRSQIILLDKFFEICQKSPSTRNPSSLVYAGKPTKIGDSVHKLPIFVNFRTIFADFRFLGF